MSGGKPPAGQDRVWIVYHMALVFVFHFDFCKVRRGDSITKSDYYYFLLKLKEPI